MLVISLKYGQVVEIGEAKVKILKKSGSSTWIKICIDAPKDVAVYRPKTTPELKSLN